MKKTILLTILFLGLSSCSSGNFFKLGDILHGPNKPEDAKYDHVIPKNPQNYRGRYKIGKAYKVRGKTFIPQDYQSYKDVGLASWYGDHHKGQMTANGEFFDHDDFTAAHPTLPLPSIVKVTNLSNGKTILVRVNDRGPFTGNRIIDISKRAAEELDFANKGVAKVEIELLTKETEELYKILNLKKD